MALKQVSGHLADPAPAVWEGDHVYFRNVGKATEKAKTDSWFIYAKDGSTGLGAIRWFGRWRKYCFFPMAETVFEENCLRDIAEFIVKITKEYKALAKSRGDKDDTPDAIVPTSPLVIPPIPTARIVERLPSPRPRKPSCY
jgi:hypothetical protein